MDALYDRIIAGDFDFEPAPHLSPAAKELICGLLHMPPEERLTARQVTYVTHVKHVTHVTYATYATRVTHATHVTHVTYVTHVALPAHAA